MMTQVELLEQYQWEHRVILLFAPNLDNEEYQKQFELLGEAEAGMLERDLKVFSIFSNEGVQGDETLTQQDIDSLRGTYEAAENEFLFILIGKDGGVKNRSLKVVSMSELFGQIDAMPMRQREMNRP